MKTKLPAAFSTCVLIAFLAVAAAHAADWAVNYGTAGPPPGTTAINADALDANGNTYVAGTFNGATLAVGTTTLTRIGPQDGFIAKLDANHNVAWAVNVGGAGATTYGFAVSVDGSGNAYLEGCFQDANLSTPALNRIGALDAYVIKFDANGGTTWARNFGGAGASACVGRGLRADGAGNVYVTGSFTNGNLTAPPLTKIGATDAYAIKLDANGLVTWAKNFGGAGASAISFACAVDSTGNAYFGGYMSAANLTTPALTRIGTLDVLVMKLDAATGNVAWAKNFGGTNSVAQMLGIGIGGSSVYMAGTFGVADLTTPALTRIGSSDAFALKLDAATGSPAWAKAFGGAGASTQAQGLAVDASGSVYIGGGFLGANLTTPPFTLTGTRDAHVIKLDSAGSITFAKNFGGAGASAQFWGVAADGAGDVTLGGYFSAASLATPPLTKIGTQDAMVVRQATGAAPAAKLDIDGNTQYDALTDGLLVLRYLFGLTGNSLIGGAIGQNATRSTAADVQQYLDGIRPALDVDGNGQQDALTDGLMILRYLFGLRGSSLVTGAIGMNATRTTSTDIESYLAPMTQ